MDTNKKAYGTIKKSNTTVTLKESKIENSNT